LLQRSNRLVVKGSQLAHSLRRSDRLIEGIGSSEDLSPEGQYANNMPS
jgi:hypothetical protein